jgi:hypothetical protein
MSETQYKVTGTFKAVDDDGNDYNVSEYTLFRHTTTTDMAEGTSADGIKEYRLGNGATVNPISEAEFEIASSGIRLYKSS